MDRVPDFESVGCAFESRRGRLYIGVIPINITIYTAYQPTFRVGLSFLVQPGAVNRQY